MSIFDTWDDVNVTYRRPVLPNTVRLTYSTKRTPQGEKQYRRMLVSKSLIRECGTDTFVLKNKGNTYALVPDDNGNLLYRGGRIIGISSSAIDGIVEKINEEECKAKVIDGAIVFPVGNEFFIG